MGSHVSCKHLTLLVIGGSQLELYFDRKNKVENISIRKKIDIILILCDILKLKYITKYKYYRLMLNNILNSPVYLAL